MEGDAFKDGGFGGAFLYAAADESDRLGGAARKLEPPEEVDGVADGARCRLPWGF